MALASAVQDLVTATQARKGPIPPFGSSVWRQGGKQAHEEALPKSFFCLLSFKAEPLCFEVEQPYNAGERLIATNAAVKASLGQGRGYQIRSDIEEVVHRSVPLPLPLSVMFLFAVSLSLGLFSYSDLCRSASKQGPYVEPRYQNAALLPWQTLGVPGTPTGRDSTEAACCCFCCS